MTCSNEAENSTLQVNYIIWNPYVFIHCECVLCTHVFKMAKTIDLLLHYQLVLHKRYQSFSTHFNRFIYVRNLNIFRKPTPLISHHHRVFDILLAIAIWNVDCVYSWCLQKNCHKSCQLQNFNACHQRVMMGSQVAKVQYVY